MNWTRSSLPVLLVPALAASASVPKKDQVLCENLMALNGAKLTDTQSMEMTLMSQNGNWQGIQRRLVEINTERKDFWFNLYFKDKAQFQNLVEYIKFTKSLWVIEMWRPDWKPKDYDHARGVAAKIGEERFQAIMHPQS